MISKKLFDQIQLALVERGKPRKKRGKKGFQFMGFATCGECGYAITCERKVKKSGRLYHYYHCTFKSKTRTCSQTSFLREEELARQVTGLIKAASLSGAWRDRFLERLEGESLESRQSSALIAQKLRLAISTSKAKLDRLTDAYLAEALDFRDYQERKNALLAEKKTQEEELSDFERSGNHWLELMSTWILETNQAENLVQQENLSEMRDFLGNVGSNPRLTAKTLLLDFKKPFAFLAAAHSAAPEFATVGSNSDVNANLWTLPGSNRSPPHCKCGALPNELRALLWG